MSNKYIDSSYIDKAIKFAVEAHQNQERNGQGFPYIIHPLEALSIASTMTNDEEILAAAILHDIIEDTPYTYEDILDQFGKRVADLVDCESDPEYPGKTPEETWIMRKQIGIDRIKNGTREFQIVAMSDKLSNMRAIYQDYQKNGDKVWDKFHIKVFEAHKWRYTELVKAFDKIEDTLAYLEFKELVNKVFNH